MTDGPRLTVIIPTRDRCVTLASAIQSCLTQDYPLLNVVVSDNCSTDGTAELVASISDTRLRYARTPRRLSMTGNFEFGLTLAAADCYLMHLGDDDGLIAGGAAQVAKIIRETGAKAVNSPHAVYHWPSSLYPGLANRLIMPRGRGYRWVEGLEAARRVISFRENYTHLPSTYSGFVSKTIVDKIAASGSYYSSITPDSYSGFVNAGFIDRFAVPNWPFAIAGLSGRSNGGSNVTTTDASEANRYIAENDLPTHSEIAYCPKSIALVVAEAFLQARDRAPRLREVEFDVARLCHVALRDAPGSHYAAVRDAVSETAQRHGVSVKTPAQPTFGQRIDHRATRLLSQIRRLSQGYRRIDAAKHGVVDVAGAARLAAELLGPFRN